LSIYYIYYLLMVFSNIRSIDMEEELEPLSLMQFRYDFGLVILGRFYYRYSTVLVVLEIFCKDGVSHVHW
jgi:hypothetical protein